ncbi:hypothetical protein GWK47_002364 [Chionoecetes opilio]|uniref:Uncharacterized protein n=1 Tax=Chionoecetes opilio TaxID=41210 RepID=A0A8J5CI25_CHIOP|nr:hypothetical protein GWK47_002364 [Chionoecetes opilio]
MAWHGHGHGHGMAIRSNINTSETVMRKAIWASFFHLSAKENNEHALCPKGEAKPSWCWVKRAEAKEEEPAPHSEKQLYLAKLPQEKLDLIKSVYRDLTNPDLLHRCLKGRTQNPNESLYAKVWRKVSKDKFAGLHRTILLTQATALEHNFGHRDSSFLCYLGFPNSPHLLAALRRKDLKTKRRSTSSAKKRKTKKVGKKQHK